MACNNGTEQIDYTKRRGARWSLKVSRIVADNGVAYPITGAVIHFNLRRVPGGDSLISVASYDEREIKILDALIGSFTVTLRAGIDSHLKLGTYYYDVEVITPLDVIKSSGNGDGTVSLTGDSGTMTFTDASVPEEALEGMLLVPSGAGAPNQLTVKVTETPQTPGSALVAAELLTDYTDFTAGTEAVNFVLNEGDVKYPNFLSGTLTLV